MSSYSRLALVGDVGGSHARFAISDVDELTISHYASFRRDLFASLEEAIGAYLKSVPQRPTMAGIAVASPLAGRLADATSIATTMLVVGALSALGVAAYLPARRAERRSLGG